MDFEDKELNMSYVRAQKRVAEIKGFYSNLLAYCVIIPFLMFVNYMTYWEYKWFWFSAVGWGVGVLIHAFITFGVSKDWEERKIKELMEKDEF